MPESQIDPFDIGALERAVNDSATRVSGLWLSFVAFSAYVAASASMISHRQIFLEEPIKLPTINIDLPLIASAILLPILFVIYHVFALVQVVLLARTADAYNQALDHGMPESDSRTIVRQRLANTLFAQLFAGSPREREGALGWLLRVMAWITLAIAPVLVLMLFEIKFLPYHSAAVTWTHRALIALDLLVVLFLWAGAVDPRRDITVRSVLAHRYGVTIAALLVVIALLVATYPGEQHASWLRGSASSADPQAAECHTPWLIALLLPANFDRISLPGTGLIDPDKFDNVEKASASKKEDAYIGERTRSFGQRNLRCANFAGSDLRRVSFQDSDLTYANLSGALLQGASFGAADLSGALLAGAQLQGAALGDTTLESAILDHTDLSGMSFEGVNLRGASLKEVILHGTSLRRAKLTGADLRSAKGNGVDFAGASLQAANLIDADLPGALLQGAQMQGTRFAGAKLQGAMMNSTTMQGADLQNAQLIGARFDGTNLGHANFDAASLWGASPPANEGMCNQMRVRSPDLTHDIILLQAGQRKVSTGADKDSVNKYIEGILVGIPAGLQRERTKMQLTNLLAVDPTTLPLRQQAWEECATKAAESGDDSYEPHLVAYLVSLACDKNVDGNFIAEGIARYWVTKTFLGRPDTDWTPDDSLDGTKKAVDEPTKALASALLSLDGKPCPGGAKLRSEARLRDLVKAN